MKKWTIRVAVMLLGAFLYLGTGYQFAKLNWDQYHSTETAHWREDSRLGKLVYEVL